MQPYQGKHLLTMFAMLLLLMANAFLATQQKRQADDLTLKEQRIIELEERLALCSNQLESGRNF